MLIKVKVFPKSKKTRVSQKGIDSFDVYVKAKAEQGKANQAVISALSLFLKIDSNKIKLIKGAKKHNKIFEIPKPINQIDKAVQVLENGGIIAYPTDTIYGIGCDIFNERTIKKIFRTKKRSFNKPLLVAISNFKMLKKIALISPKDEAIIKKLFPGPITLLLPKKEIISNLITSNSKLIGVRMPDQKIILDIIEKFGAPIITTSANISGHPAPIKQEDIDLKIDFVVKGECRYKKPSTIIDFQNKKIVRQGAGKVRNILSIINN